MRALTVVPGRSGTLRLEEVDEPPPDDGPVVVQALWVGVCGTDLEIVGGTFGTAPPGARRLVVGHESLGQVLQAPPAGPVAPGDLVVGVVRHPDPEPCPACAAGRWDFCANGRFTERGITGRHGFAQERFRLHEDHAVGVPPALGRLGVLVEPASTVVKAWEQAVRVGARGPWSPDRVLVTGAGPIGLLAALVASHHGAEVCVLDREAGGIKPELVRALGARYATGSVAGAGRRPDVVLECTGSPAMVLEAAAAVHPAGVVCAMGRTLPAPAWPPAPASLPAPASPTAPTSDPAPIPGGGTGAGPGGTGAVVLDNKAIIGTVNASTDHYRVAVDVLAQADRTWVGRLITRTVPLERFAEAFERRPGDVKVVVEVAPIPA